MGVNRRSFIKGVLGLFGSSLARKLGVGVAAATTSATVLPTVAKALPSAYGTRVRAQVFEVIVRQAVAGAPWREICEGPMRVNGISCDEVEEEMQHRLRLKRELISESSGRLSDAELIRINSKVHRMRMVPSLFTFEIHS